MNQAKMLAQLLRRALGVNFILHRSSTMHVVIKHSGKGRVSIVGREFCRFLRQRRRAVVMEAKSSDPTPVEEGQEVFARCYKKTCPMGGGPIAIVLPPARYDGIRRRHSLEFRKAETLGNFPKSFRHPRTQERFRFLEACCRRSSRRHFRREQWRNCRIWHNKETRRTLCSRTSCQSRPMRSVMPSSHRSMNLPTGEDRQASAISRLVLVSPTRLTGRPHGQSPEGLRRALLGLQVGGRCAVLWHFSRACESGAVCRHSVVPSSAVLGLAGCFPTPMLSSHIPMPGRSSSIESKKRWIATVLLHR